MRKEHKEELEKMEKMSEIMKDMEDMEEVKIKVWKMTESVDELTEKVAAMEIDLNEQAITASAVNGHLESGVATAKQDRDGLLMFVDV